MKLKKFINIKDIMNLLLAGVILLLITQGIRHFAKKYTDKQTYIGVGYEGKYALINTSTGETKEFIPSGYELLGYAYSYQTFPDFLLLKKDSNLYSYNLLNHEIKQIKNIKIKQTESIVLHSSITEKHKFYIVVYDTKPNPDNDKFGEDIVGERRYFFDAISNQINGAEGVKIPKFPIGTAFEYDSRYSRFFIWPAGEPIPSSLPLLVYDIKSGEKKEIVSLEDFGIDKKDEYGGEVEYSNGFFTVMSPTSPSRITLVEPTEDILKTDLALSGKISSKLDFYIYSTMYVKEKNTIFLGSDDKIALVKFNNNNSVNIKFLYHPEKVYINFPYTDGNNIYYKGEADEITIVDLNTLKFKRKVPSKYYNTITLFR